MNHLKKRYQAVFWVWRVELLCQCWFPHAFSNTSTSSNGFNFYSSPCVRCDSLSIHTAWLIKSRQHFEWSVVLSKMKQIISRNNNHQNALKIQTSSCVCFLPQTTAQAAASAQPATVPAPAAPAAAAEVVTVSGVDPEKAKQLTQAVAEQVRTLASGNALLSCQLAKTQSLTFLDILTSIIRLCFPIRSFYSPYFAFKIVFSWQE